MIRFDPVRATSSIASVVAVCACGWRTIANDHAGANSLATAHLEIAHPAASPARARALDASRKRSTRR